MSDRISGGIVRNDDKLSGGITRDLPRITGAAIADAISLTGEGGFATFPIGGVAVAESRITGGIRRIDLLGDQRVTGGFISIPSTGSSRGPVPPYINFTRNGGRITLVQGWDSPAQNTLLNSVALTRVGGRLTRIDATDGATTREITVGRSGGLIESLTVE